MKEVADYRREIDALDDELVDVLNRRFAIVRELQERKRALGLPAKDAVREREIATRVMSKCDPAEGDTVFAIYERLFGAGGGMIETIARGICTVDGKVLLCRAKGGSTHYLPGGHIEFGETGREALVREIAEETGCDSAAGDFIGVVENQFVQKGKSHAEINLIYRLTLKGVEPKDVKAAEPWIEFVWWPVDDLSSARLLPAEMEQYVRGDLV